MRESSHTAKDCSGFTIIELLMVIVILGILAGIAIPGFSVWLPNYRLKMVARDIHSNMQLTKLGAIKQNKTWRVVFDPGVTPGVTPGRYFICSDDNDDGWDTPAPGNDVVEKTVNFIDIGDDFNYGSGDATFSATKTPGAIPADFVSYINPDNAATFNSRGVGTGGYVYIANNRGRAYAIGTRTSGVILMRRWNGTAWE